MAPIKPEIQEKRINHIRNVRGIIFGTEARIDDAESFSAVKGLFSRIHKQNQWDWFTVFEQLGCPGRKKSRKISYELFHIRKFIVGKSNENVLNQIENIRTIGVEKHLDLFLNPRSGEA